MSSQSTTSDRFGIKGFREIPASRRPGVWRYFFVALSSAYALVAVVGFAPEFDDLFGGTFQFSFIPAIAYTHGALMMAWLLFFIVQTSLAASGVLKWHRTLGLASVSLAVVMWISMGVVSVGQLIRLTSLKTEVESWVYDVVLSQICTMGLFALFFVWGVLVRRDSSSHKRLLSLAALVLLQPAVDRMYWLPNSGMPFLWPILVLLIPLFVFDLVSVKRIHPVTVTGAGAIIVANTTINLILAMPGWHEFAQAMTNTIR